MFFPSTATAAAAAAAAAPDAPSDDEPWLCCWTLVRLPRKSGPRPPILPNTLGNSDYLIKLIH